MNRKSSRLFVAPIVALLLIAVSSDANADFTIKRIINCDKGRDVQRVLDSNVFSLPMELRLVGTCRGFEIMHDDVLITPLHGGACSTATVDGGIFLNSVDRTEIRCITVDGAGIRVLGGTATLEEVDIRNNFDIGLSLGGNAYVEVFNSTIRNNGEGVSIERSNASFDDVHVTGNRNNGITVEHNSNLEFMDGSVINNDGTGISVNDGSELVLSGGAVLTSGRGGVAVRFGSVVDIDEVHIADNGRLGVGSGVFMLGNSTAQIIGGSITNNGHGVGLWEHSYATISGTRIENNRRSGVALAFDSGARLGPDTSVKWNEGEADVWCDGEESSAAIHFAADVGSVECTHLGF